MTDIISLECIAEAEPGAISPDVYRGALIKALTAIKELVAERDDALTRMEGLVNNLSFRIAEAKDWKVRAEKAEADLAAARAALRHADTCDWMWKAHHAPAIAAARAEKEKTDDHT